MPLDPPPPPRAPLTALRAFEAAGRHGSFLRAAAELAVSPGAVAQQIKKLEDWIGSPLFERHAQGVSLTPLARQVLPALTEGFDTLGKAVQILRQAGDKRSVRVAALPAVAQLWLSPRLSALRDALPGMDLSIHALDQRPSLERAEFDLAIYPARLDAASAKSRVLDENRLTPVAAPQIAARFPALPDLKDATLIHDSAWSYDWAAWLDAHGLRDVPSDRGPTHSLYSIAVERCVAGDGLLIGHTALIGQHLADGRLVELLPDHAIPGPDLCLFLPEGYESKEPLAEFAAVLQGLAEKREG